MGDALLGVPDPIERLLRAVWLYTHYTGSRGFGAIPANDRQIVGDEKALRRACPDVWPAGTEFSLGSRPAWDSRAIANWVPVHAKTKPDGGLLIERRGLLGSKQERISGWPLNNGSTIRARRGEIYDYLHVTVTAQGTLTYGTSLVPRQPDEGLNAHALRQLARICGLRVGAREAPAQTPVSSLPYDPQMVQRMVSGMLAGTESDESPLPKATWRPAP